MNDDNERPQNPKSPPEVWARLKEVARENRKDPTAAEDFLWHLLSLMRPGGMKFRRQHSIATFIVDFYCIKARLVIEVDGSSHDGNEEQDAFRQTALEGLNIKVLRFTNEEVLHEPLRVIAQIESAGSGKA